MVKSALVSTLLLAVSAFAHPHAHGGPSSDQLYSFLKARTSVSAAASEGAAANPSSGSSNGSAEGGRGSSTAFSAARFPDVQAVLEGNKRFVQNRDAKAIQELVDNGQKPPFMMVACSDSRAPEATIFDSKPGTFFMERNIANQYKPGDENAQSVMAYGIHVLGVQHIVILGHYGCGGIAASIATPPKNNINVASHIVNTWIGDIRQLYLTSNRSEIVEMRTANLAIEAAGGTVEEPKIREPGFRALVEENVKLQVQRLVDSSVMKNVGLLSLGLPVPSSTRMALSRPPTRPLSSAAQKRAVQSALSLSTDGCMTSRVERSSTSTFPLVQLDLRTLFLLRLARAMRRAPPHLRRLLEARAQRRRLLRKEEPALLLRQLRVRPLPLLALQRVARLLPPLQERVQRARARRVPRRLPLRLRLEMFVFTVHPRLVPEERDVRMHARSMPLLSIFTSAWRHLDDQVVVKSLG